MTVLLIMKYYHYTTAFSPSLQHAAVAMPAGQESVSVHV